MIGGSKAIFAVVTIAQRILLARILTPKDFGLAAIALMTVSFLELVSQTGFQQALIHRKRVGDADLDTTWVVSVARGAVLALILFATAEPVAAFFGAPEAAGLQRLIAVVLVIRGLTNPAMVLFEKELAFSRVAWQQAGGLIAEIAVSIALAYALKNAYALVLGTVARYCAVCVLSFVLSPYRPSLALRWKNARELYRFGRWITLNNVILYLLNQGDNAVVGRLLGATSLGFYNTAFRFSNLPATHVSQIVNKVGFPAYVKLRDAGRPIGDAYLRVLGHVLFISLPLGGASIVLSPIAVETLLGAKWEPMIPAMQILAVYGALRSIGANSGSVFQALGRPQLLARTATVRLILTAAVIVPMTNRFGIEGTALAVLGSALAVAPYTYWLTVRLSECGWRPFLATLLVPSLNTTLLVGSLLALQELLAGAPPLVELVLCMGGGLAIYVAVAALWARTGRYTVGTTLLATLGDGLRRRESSRAAAVSSAA